ncbi:hypothetical protein BHE74_00023909 [Ensete ventricosum]|uniref:Uncharacterized protein n=1 Tax=Ensete ventricosum TaxID=4639 RepID=A0A426ZBM6_ENSVE|nr:hypothetical protein B296_00021542 [Ensete ventricosum]RWW21256.1 hypothetical protein GW17_00014595 [Ensete ventricosum]RWW68578.1 hypothetical protein BHE74_00023909 [Ensete ventricosum]RZS14935.1 hypothetical protein BHM03_00046698 [Ensete ventricosum]
MIRCCCLPSCDRHLGGFFLFLVLTVAESMAVIEEVTGAVVPRLSVSAFPSMVRSSNATKNNWSGNALLVSSMYTYMENIS